MSYQSKLNKGIQLQNEGEFESAIEVYQTLLSKKPKSFDARQLLALSMHQSGKALESIREFKHAITLNNHHAATRNNFGNAYMDIDEYHAAKAQFEKAISIAPNFFQAFNNLGNCLQKLHDYEGAVKTYNRAIRLAPKEAQFHDNLGVVLFKLGKFEESLCEFQVAHNLDQSMSSVLVHLFDLLMMMHQYDQAHSIASHSINGGILCKIQKHAMYIGIAKINWLTGNFEDLELNLEASNDIHNQSNVHENIKNLKVFHNYLYQLLQYKKKNQNTYRTKEKQTLVMISESHGFAPNTTIVEYQSTAYQIRSFLITGCKLMHLAQPKQNMYNSSLNCFFSQLPLASKVIMGFGEIDCRVNEGIYHNYLKTNNDYRKSIATMVQNYVISSVAVANASSHQLIFYGVPAPHPEMIIELTDSARNDFLEIIKLINQNLKKESIRANCDLLDVYEMTKNSHGESNLKWHFDAIHLHPKAFATLFKEYLVVANPIRNPMKNPVIA